MELPKGWTLAHADRLFAFVTSGSRGWAQYYSEEGPPFIRIGDLSRETLQIDYHNAQRVRPPLDSEGTRTRVQPGDLLISITADVGIVGVVSGDVPEAYINQHIALARPHSSHSSKYIGWYLASWDGGQRQIRSMKRGATKVGLGLEDIRSLVVPLPSRSEQEEIVRVIETQFSRLDATEARLNRALVNLKRARASVLKAAVEGRLVPTEAALARAEGRDYEAASVLLDRILAMRKAAVIEERRHGKSRRSEPYDSASLPKLPDGWSWASIGQVVDSQVGHAFRSDDFTDSGVNLLRGDNIGHGTLRWGDRQRCIAESALAEHRELQLAARDIVLAMDRPVISTGLKWARVKSSDLPALLVQRVLRLRPKIQPDYFEAILNSPSFRAHLEEEAKGGGVPHISERQVQVFPLPLPPLAEQHRIVAEVDRRLSVLDRLEARITANLSRCKRLRQAILKRAFEGRLVPQEPT